MDKGKLTSWEKLFLGSVIVYVFLTLASYFLLILKLQFLFIPLLLLLFYWSFKNIRSLKFQFPSKAKASLVFLVFTLGVAGQLAVIAPSGTFQNGDLVFWSAHGHDGPWHIALMEEIKRGMSLQNPVFAGERLVNYHFFVDLIPALVNKYLAVSTLHLYFRILPLFFSVTLGASAYFLGKRLGGNFMAGLWATIFTYFAGSFGFLIGKGESVFWATQIQSSSGNPPQIASNVILLTFLVFLLVFLKKTKKEIFLICLLLASSLALFKVYAAVVLLGSLGIAAAWQVFKEKKLNLLALFVTSSSFSALLYLPNTQGSTSFLIFQPWWLIRTMIVEPSRLNWIDHELRRQHYLSLGTPKAWARIIQLETTAFLIFLFGNLGLRFLGFWDLTQISRKSLKNYFNLIFVFIILISFILPLLFLQKGVAANISQFLQYFLLLFGILAGISVAKLLAKIKSETFKITLSTLIILLMLPTQVKLLKEFYSRPAFAKISQEELKALTFIKESTPKEAVILTAPYNQYLDLGDRTPHVWDWFDTAYVAAFSSRRTYFDDHEQLDIMGYDFKKRQKFKESIFNQEIAGNLNSTLKENGIDYLYFPKAVRPKANLKKAQMKQVFENSLIEIWEVK